MQRKLAISDQLHFIDKKTDSEEQNGWSVKAPGKSQDKLRHIKYSKSLFEQKLVPIWQNQTESCWKLGERLL